MTRSDKTRLLSGFNGNAPADGESILRFQEESRIRLPQDYAQFLQRTNGGEGFIGPNAYVILWRVEELLQLNKDYEVAKYAPGLFLFGSNGGGEAFAFDMRSEQMPVVSVPFVGMELGLARPLAPNFSGLLDKLFSS